MALVQKPLRDQTIVITGATSGIGLATARMAANRGARLVLASRNGEALAEVAREIAAAGGSAETVVADVASEADVARIVATALARFGTFDTFVNNAGTAVYSNLTELPLDEHRRIFETNYWGTVHGSLAAVKLFREREGGGTLINVGSVNSDFAIPYLSAYAASKHAVKGFTDALRLELLHDRAPVQVTLIKPSGIATPFPKHARSRIGAEPRVVPPLYAPELVADAILHAATYPVRDITVGGAGRAIAVATALAPNVMDRVLAAGVPPLSEKPRPPSPGDDLDTADKDGDVHEPGSRGIPFSPYTTLQKYPPSALALSALGIGILAARHLLGGRGRAGRG
ncbi:glucose a-dehydrogenase YxnA [Aureimonas endophytica]|uniref:Glucose a-dehydrogenase YxnA n=1 Tax=Aureimonas endophytica TaxID=2027858 RepID=A0A917A1T9_9HYPH|nr:SDR family oxidoreductase [Aureimonas endophytica]GGE22869.1 glucose a-dehydrogenase YxnA [Aureimonas endophytica]